MTISEKILKNVYQYLATSPYLWSLEHLTIKDTRLNVAFHSLLLMSKDKFPNLRVLELPFNSLGHFSEKIHLDPRFSEIDLRFQEYFYLDSEYSSAQNRHFSRDNNGKLTTIWDILRFRPSKLLLNGFPYSSNWGPSQIFDIRIDSHDQRSIKSKQSIENITHLDLSNTSINDSFFESCFSKFKRCFTFLERGDENLYQNLEPAEMNSLKPNYEYYRMNRGLSSSLKLVQLWVRQNNLTNSSLYLISHSPVFNNLKGMENVKLPL